MDEISLDNNLWLKGHTIIRTTNTRVAKKKN